MEIHAIPAEEIRFDPSYQPRRNLDEDHVRSLTGDMRENGFDETNPITAVRKGEGWYSPVKGFHRAAAALKAGIKEIPAFVIDYGDDRNFLSALADNTARLNMRPSEIIDAVRKLVDSGFKLDHIGRRIGVSRETLEADLPIAKLPPVMKKQVDDGQLPKVVARKIATVDEVGGDFLTARKWAMYDEEGNLVKRTGKAMLARVDKYLEEIAGNGKPKSDPEDKREIKKNSRLLFRFAKMVSQMDTIGAEKLVNTNHDLEGIEQTIKKIHVLGNAMLTEVYRAKAP